MICVENLTKRYGEKTAVDALSFTVRPGMVTGFLGPNGAGKSTTMRMILGLDRPRRARRSSTAAATSTPRRCSEVGALLEAKAIHPGRSAYNHLLALAATHGIGRRRVDEVIDMRRAEGGARKRAGGFSLGMGQRLGIASALLGDPQIVDAGRAGQRPGPRGRAVDPQPAQGPRRRGADRLRLLPPDERDGADRRAPHRHRARPADRRHGGRRSSSPRPRSDAACGCARRRPRAARRCWWATASTVTSAGPGCWRSRGWPPRIGELAAAGGLIAARADARRRRWRRRSWS